MRYPENPLSLSVGCVDEEAGKLDLKFPESRLVLSERAPFGT